MQISADNKALYFTSAGCSVCTVLKPKVAQLISTHYPKLEWQEINITSSPELAAQYSVFTVPVFILLLEGKEYVRLIRAFSLDEVREKTDRVYRWLFDE
ncbi:thioredoxin family protein [Microscilla marina]|uniref:Thiol-disulfide isomerase and thioredoxins n=1 Tax=Microscilla marina ATCC 23134 TaxID=313606 RepID=A1ZE34_MICM2|nr:thioredoxin family protein [Microscilla marina]EAY31342.1 thiol-disulfide isomerase and thioredoxins [Microscilla marina ATCC 23134]